MKLDYNYLKKGVPVRKTFHAASDRPIPLSLPGSQPIQTRNPPVLSPPPFPWIMPVATISPRSGSLQVPV